MMKKTSASKVSPHSLRKSARRAISAGPDVGFPVRLIKNVQTGNPRLATSLAKMNGTCEEERRNTSLTSTRSSGTGSVCGKSIVVREVELAELLRAQGLKATPQRLAILQVLAEVHQPLALHTLSERIPHAVANQSTLYRAMHDLTGAGIVRSVDLRHNHAHYELVSETEHHHIVCTSCGVVEEYVSPHCRTVEDEALAQSSAFATIDDHSFEFYGTCKQCMEK